MFVNSVDVSVIIPVHNRATMIGDAVKSALNQDTDAILEIIVVDDGSTDGSGDIAAAIDPRVKVIRHELARGPGAARNSGLAIARGEYIAFLDSDDVFCPNRISSALNYLRSHPKVILTCGGMSGGDNPFMLSSAASAPVHWTRPLQEMLKCGNPIYTPTVTARLQAINDCGCFDETLYCSQDYDLWIRMAEKGEFTHLSVIVAQLRRTSHGQMTKRDARLNPAIIYARAWQRANLAGEDKKLARPVFANYARMRLAQLVREKQGKAIWQDMATFKDALAWHERMVWRMIAMFLWPFSVATATSRP